jgi:hypothetical protein
MIVVNGQPNLFQVVLTLGPSRGFPNFLHRRQQQADQNSDDCNDDQQLDESKPDFPAGTFHHNGTLRRKRERERVWEYKWFPIDHYYPTV